MKAISLLFLSLIISGCWYEDGATVPSTKSFIKQYIPDGAKRIEHEDTHGGFHGDGELWVVYELREKQQEEFEGIIFESNVWKPLSLPDEVVRHVRHGDWIDAADGSYLFHDFQPDWYPPHSSYSGPWYERGSFNFCVFLYDREESKIYVYNIDT